MIWQEIAQNIQSIWSGKVINIQVTNTSPAAIEVRVLLSATCSKYIQPVL
jgi:hypothetical protein